MNNSNLIIIIMNQEEIEAHEAAAVLQKAEIIHRNQLSACTYAPLVVGLLWCSYPEDVSWKSFPVTVFTHMVLVYLTQNNKELWEKIEQVQTELIDIYGGAEQGKVDVGLLGQDTNLVGGRNAECMSPYIESPGIKDQSGLGARQRSLFLPAKEKHQSKNHGDWDEQEEKTEDGGLQRQGTTKSHNRREKFMAMRKNKQFMSIQDPGGRYQNKIRNQELLKDRKKVDLQIDTATMNLDFSIEETRLKEQLLTMSTAFSLRVNFTGTILILVLTAVLLLHEYPFSEGFSLMAVLSTHSMCQFLINSNNLQVVFLFVILFGFTPPQKTLLQTGFEIASRLCLMLYYVEILGFKRGKQQENMRQQEQLFRTKNSLKEIMNSIPFGVCILNLVDVVVMNSQFLEQMELDSENLSNDTLKMVLRKMRNKEEVSQQQTSDDTNDLETKVQQRLSASQIDDLHASTKGLDPKENIQFQEYYMNKSLKFSEEETGKEEDKDLKQFFRVSLSEIDWNNKRCILLTLQDTTHIKHTEDKQMIQKIKQSIFNTFTHELMTPLNGLINSLLLTEEHINQPQETIDLEYMKKLFAGLHACTFSMKYVIKDFFDYSLMSAGNLHLNNDFIDLESFVDDIKYMFSNLINNPDVEFSVHKSHWLPETIFSDKERISQILQNLVANAIKFTEEGEIKFQVSVKQSPQKEWVLRFQVSDTGIGIPQSKLNQIFNLFEEANAFAKIRDEKEPSARFGLPISQNLCNHMGTTLRCHSVVGKGSKFWFDIAIESEKQEEEAMRRDTDDSAQLANTLISPSLKKGTRKNSLNLGQFNCFYSPLNMNTNAIGELHSSSSEREESDERLQHKKNKPDSVEAGSGGKSQSAEKNLPDLKKYRDMHKFKKMSKTERNFNKSSKTSGRKKDPSKMAPVIDIPSGENQSSVIDQQAAKMGTEVIKKKPLVLSVMQLSSKEYGGDKSFESKKNESKALEDQNQSPLFKRMMKSQAMNMRRGSLKNTSPIQDSQKDQRFVKQENTPKKKQEKIVVNNMQRKRSADVPKRIQLDDDDEIWDRDDLSSSMDAMNLVQEEEEKHQTNNKIVLDVFEIPADEQIIEVRPSVSEEDIDMTPLETEGDYKHGMTEPSERGLLAIGSLHRHNNDLKLLSSIKGGPASKIEEEAKSDDIEFDILDGMQKKPESIEIVVADIEGKQGFTVDGSKKWDQIQDSNSSKGSRLKFYEIRAPSLHIGSPHYHQKSSDPSVIPGTTQPIQKSAFRPHKEETLYSADPKEKMNSSINESHVEAQADGKNEEQSQSAEYLKASEEQINSPLRNNCCPEILIADDIDFNRFILMQVLERFFSYKSAQAVNGKKSIDKVVEQSKKTCCKGFRLILMDYDMPIMNGLEASKNLKSMMAKKEIPQIPIAALTAFIEEKEACMNSGMDFFLTKPASADMLMKVFKKIEQDVAQQ